MSEVEGRLDHVGLNVVDLAAAEAWYGEFFDFTREVVMHVAEIDTDIVMLVNKYGHRIELLSRPGSAFAEPVSHPGDKIFAGGFGHIAIQVADIDTRYAELVGRGVRSLLTVTPSAEPGVRIAFVADLEGNLIELVERTDSPH